MDALRFGRQFRALRIRLRRRQSDVATAADLSRSLVSSIDRGALDGVTLGSLRRASAVLGADVDLRLRWRGEHLDRLLDEDHAAIVEATVLLLRRHRWTADIEVSFAIWGERGSIDILAHHSESAALLVIEVKSVIPDSQALLHGLDRKARLAGAIAQERGWQTRHVSRLLVAGDSSTSRRRIRRLGATYDAALPARGPAVRRWIGHPTESMNGLLFLPFASQTGTIRRPRGRERVRTARPGMKPCRGSQTSPRTAVG